MSVRTSDTSLTADSAAARDLGAEHASASRAEWEKQLRERYKDANFGHRNRSGMELRPAYDPADLGEQGLDRPPMPGQYPFTRGIYPIHYQYQPWMDLQIIGYGVPSQLRERMALLRREGGARGYFGGEAYNVIFDMPTSMGFDPDYPGVVGSVGQSGVSICKTSDYEALLAGADLSKTHFSMVSNAGSPAMLALYVAAAKRMGFDGPQLRGNITNYIWDFFGHCGGMNFSPRGSYRLCVDVVAYGAEHIPNFGTVTFSEHNICEAGATNVQAVGLALAAVVAMNEECVELGLPVDTIASRYGFHVRFGEDFFEDIAKTRALRSLYAKLNKERFGCQTSNALKARIHAQTAGSLLTVQQPANNIVRNSIGALGAVIAGVNSMTINAFDEALGLPTEQAVTLSLRTSQVIGEESGIKNVSDPLGGSYYVEALTAQIEDACMELIEKVDEQGGLIACIESGWARAEVAASAYEWRRQVEDGTRGIVGVNRFATDDADDTPVFRPDPNVAKLALADLERHRASRDQAACDAALDQLRNAAQEVMAGRNIGATTAALIAAADADATLGEMQSVLFDVFGRNK
jgi:methylmalonyl-CoA mutase N-terminal domain/subunit